MVASRWILLFVAALAASGCARREWTTTVQPVANPAAAGSFEPQLTGSGDDVILSWVERAGETATLKFVTRTAAGWSAPLTVTSGNDWFLSYADVPSVTRLTNGTLLAQWLKATDPLIEAYDLLLSYSTDEGKTWSTPFTPHHDGTMTQHGFASVVELPDGIGIVWLDGRAIELDTTNPDGGEMSVRYAAFDRSWKQTADAQIDSRVCECCPLAAAVTSDGVITAYRDRSDTEIRDIAVSRLEGGRWSPPQTVHDDGWEIAACPVNGPMLAAEGRNVAATWFTVNDNQGQAWAAFSNDAGRTWGTPIRLDDASSLGRVDVELLDDGSAVALWIEFANGRSELRMRRIAASGARSAAITVSAVGDARASGYPRLARAGNELLFAWTESTPDGEMSVKTAVAKLP
jgi:hypothetical protein